MKRSAILLCCCGAVLAVIALRELKPSPIQAAATYKVKSLVVHGPYLLPAEDIGGLPPVILTEARDDPPAVEQGPVTFTEVPPSSGRRAPRPTSDPFTPSGLQQFDAQVAASDGYLIVATGHNMVFYGKDGQPLESKLNGNVIGVINSASVLRQRADAAGHQEQPEPPAAICVAEHRDVYRYASTFRPLPETLLDHLRVEQQECVQGRWWLQAMGSPGTLVATGSLPACRGRRTRATASGCIGGRAHPTTAPATMCLMAHVSSSVRARPLRPATRPIFPISVSRRTMPSRRFTTTTCGRRVLDDDAVAVSRGVVANLLPADVMAAGDRVLSAWSYWDITEPLWRAW